MDVDLIQHRSGNSGVSRLNEEDVDSEGSEKGGRFRIQNIGGSFIIILQVALLAWGVRQLRSVIAKRRENKQKVSNNGSLSSLSYALISPTALRMLIDLLPTPFFLLDARPRDVVKSAPAPIANILNIPEGEVRATLQLPALAWKSRFGNLSQPGKRDIIVFLSSHSNHAQTAAASAAGIGYSRCCVLSGGIQSYVMSMSEQMPTLSDFSVINRDALALLLEKASMCFKNGKTNIIPNFFLIDVRRHDERTLYGSIPSSCHIPVDLLPSALAMDENSFSQTFHFNKPKKDELVIFHCRTNRRAIWAAQLAKDSGMQHCYVYKQGSYGWRLHPSVMAYESFEEGEEPSPPISFEVDRINRSSAEKELSHLGLI